MEKCAQAPAGATPQHLWGCDPLWESHVKLLGAQFAALPDACEQGDVCWLGTHPVRFFHMLGVVVSVDPRHPSDADTRVNFIIDDGSALVDCISWTNRTGRRAP